MQSIVAAMHSAREPGGSLSTLALSDLFATPHVIPELDGFLAALFVVPFPGYTAASVSIGELRLEIRGTAASDGRLAALVSVVADLVVDLASAFRPLLDMNLVPDVDIVNMDDFNESLSLSIAHHSSSHPICTPYESIGGMTMRLSLGHTCDSSPRCRLMTGQSGQKRIGILQNGGG
ncbi:hypothetical protein [Paenibacillus sp. GCM10023250]|uniref:hypothetical protein n=1 Tax=Paenibacillus sp. GCM10023250 TaxID=3252648 RepID=UPI00361A8FCF